MAINLASLKIYRNTLNRVELAPSRMKRFLFGCILGVSLLGAVAAQESSGSVDVEPSQVKAGTSIYDAESIRELYTQYKKENAARNKEPALIGDMETFVLKDMEVFADDLVDERELRERLDPKPQNRINRIARVNPDMAAEIQYAMRSDEVFFSKESMPRISGGDPGATADLSAQQIGAALAKIGKLFGGKKKDENER